MAGVIFHSGQSGLTTYGVIHNVTAGDVWNGSAFESFSAGNWTSYDVAMTEQSTSGYYKANFPSSIAEGAYHIAYYAQSGGSPSVSADTCIGSHTGVWDGSNWFTGLTLTTSAALQVYNQALAVSDDDPLPELTTIPSANPTEREVLMLLYMWLRNATSATSNSRTIRNNAGSAIGSATVSDDGSTFSQGKLA